jgi:hypothetical protein
MATLITKNSQTASAVPSAGSLSTGELAVNTADATLFTKHSDGSVKQIRVANATTASTVATTNWTITESSGKLFFAYGGVNKGSLDSSGNFIVTGNVTAYGTP